MKRTISEEYKKLSKPAKTEFICELLIVALMGCVGIWLTFQTVDPDRYGETLAKCLGAIIILTAACWLNCRSGSITRVDRRAKHLKEWEEEDLDELEERVRQLENNRNRY